MLRTRVFLADGIFAARDVFVYGPNGIGLILGLIQLTLKLLYPSKVEA